MEDIHKRVLRIAQNGLVAALYYGLNLFACMGYVAIGEAIALGIGYAVFMGLIRNQGFMKVLAPTRHAEVKC
ncbi:MAG: hypothetical protein E7182_01535 [Erysipelotrichaceae bacterium]|nr:hypothetical protein [Erysipelotrichaceae bacterium]